MRTIEAKGVDSTFSWENKRCQEGGHIWESVGRLNLLWWRGGAGGGEKDGLITGCITTSNYQDIETTFK